MTLQERHDRLVLGLRKMAETHEHWSDGTTSAWWRYGIRYLLGDEGIETPYGLDDLKP
jgi:hypothetical protein